MVLKKDKNVGVVYSVTTPLAEGEFKVPKGGVTFDNPLKGVFDPPVPLPPDWEDYLWPEGAIEIKNG